MGSRSVLRDSSAADDFAHLVRYARLPWPALEGVCWTHFWNGQLAVTPDHYPHLHEPAPGSIAALGYNGRSVATATAMGREIARRVLGAAADEIAYTRICDWLSA